MDIYMDPTWKLCGSLYEPHMDPTRILYGSHIGILHGSLHGSYMDFHMDPTWILYGSYIDSYMDPHMVPICACHWL